LGPHGQQFNPSTSTFIHHTVDDGGKLVSREPLRVLSVSGLMGPFPVGEIDMRTFVAGATKIDVIAHISREDLELDRLVLSRVEGSETIANAAFQTLVDRYGGRPLAEYASAPQQIDLG
jgi:hypothetical protein